MSSIVSLNIDEARRAAAAFRQGSQQFEQEGTTARGSAADLLTSFLDGQGHVRDMFEEDLARILKLNADAVELLRNLGTALAHEADEFEQVDASF